MNRVLSGLKAFLSNESGAGTLERSFARLPLVGFGGKDRMRAYRQLEKLHKAEIPLGRGLKTLYNRASDNGRKATDPRAIVFDEWINRFKRASSFSEAVADWVPPRDRMILEAGEYGGDVGKAISDVIYVSEVTKRLKGVILGGLAYPLILFLMLIGILYMFGTQVIPPFAQIKPMEEWIGIPATLATMSGIVETWTLPFLGTIAGVVALTLFSLPRLTGRLRHHLERFPPWSIYRMFQGTSFLFSLVALLKAGVPLPKAVTRLRKYANPYLDERLEATLDSINAGRNLGEALHETGYNFPESGIIEDLRIFAAIGQVESSLAKIGAEWQEETIERMKGIMRSINYVFLFLIAGAIMWIYAGLVELYQMIQSAATV